VTHQGAACDAASVHFGPTIRRTDIQRSVDYCVQVIGALAIMMDMKKGVVSETVKENRADELSAMFNMMTDNRKRIMGKSLLPFPAPTCNDEHYPATL